MQTFHTSSGNFTGTEVTITGPEHHHATRSCRVRIGEIIGVLDGCGKRVHARIERIGSQSLTAAIERDVSGEGEPGVEIIIALSAVKPSRFETAVEKCTEIGVRGFVPVIAERCEPNIALRLKVDRLRKIALGAAKQSKRSWIPEVFSPETLEEILERTEGTVLAGSRDAEKSLERACGGIGENRRITMLIGPEGDFSEAEYDAMSAAGVVPVTLGGLTMRAETAAIVAASRIVNVFGTTG